MDSVEEAARRMIDAVNASAKDLGTEERERAAQKLAVELDILTQGLALRKDRWQIVTYVIDVKTPYGEWIKHLPVHEEFADEQLAECRAKHPDKGFRLRRMTTIAEVIERV